jgi:lysophospholipase L1-like esterase
MDTLVKSSNAKFYIYKHPSVQEVWLPYRELIKAGNEVFDFDKKIIKLLEENNLNYIEMNQYFLENQGRGPFHLLPSDAHNNSEGYKMEAEKLANVLR